VRLLTTVFVLCLQVDVSLRLLYGHANTAGLELSFSLLTAAALLIALAYTRGPLRLGPCLATPIAILLVTTVLAGVFTTERFASLNRLVFELGLVAIWVLGVNLVRSADDVRRLVALLSITLIVQSLVYMVQSSLGMTFTLTGYVIEADDRLPRPGGTVSTNPAGFASYIVPILMVNIAALLSARGPRRWRTWTCVALGLVALVLTFTRAAWGGFALALACTVALGRRTGQIRTRAVVCVVVIGALAVAALSPMIALRLQESVADAYSERAGLMRIAIDVITTHPLVGIGPGAYEHRFKEFVSEDLRDQWLYTVHNEYLLRAAEAGVVAGIAYVWLLLRGFRQSVRVASRATDSDVRAMALGWTGGLIALAWQMYWVPWRGFAYNSILWLMLGIIEGADRLLTARTAPDAPAAQPQSATAGVAR
jgi:O-antigen ligase